MKKYITILSVISSLAVVLLHSNGCFWTFSYGKYWITANIIECVFYFAVPIFFMITGANLIDYIKKYDTKTYFKKRIKKTLIPFIIWSLIGLIYLIIINRSICLNVINLKYIIEGIINTKFISIYWFFMPLFSIYLCIPVLSQIKNKKLVFKYILITYFILNSLLPLVFNLLKLSWNGSLSLVICTGYLFYPILGYYLDNYKIKQSIKYMIYVLGIVGLLVHILGTMYLSYEQGQIVQTFKGYLNVPCVLYSTAVYIFVMSLEKNKIFDIIYSVADKIKDVTFDVYLIHWYILNLISKYIYTNTISIKYRIGFGLLTFLISILISKSLKKIPIIRKLLP